MDTVKFDRKNVKTVAHRGLSGIETENTVAAFVAAANRSYYGIETDVHKTLDGHFVLIHDNSTNRVSKKNKKVKRSILLTLKKIVLKDFYSKEAPREDLRIPTLADYISICKKYEKVCILEIKNHFSYDDIKKLVKEIEKLNYIEHTVFISFDFDNLKNIKSILPNQKVQFLTGKCTDELIGKLKNYKMDIDIQYTALNEELVNKLHNNGIEINTYTVDNLETANKFANLNIDYLTTNILE